MNFNPLRPQTPSLVRLTVTSPLTQQPGELSVTATRINRRIPGPYGQNLRTAHCEGCDKQFVLISRIS